MAEDHMIHFPSPVSTGSGSEGVISALHRKMCRAPLVIFNASDISSKQYLGDLKTVQCRSHHTVINVLLQRL